MVILNREVIGEEWQCASKRDGACLFVLSAKPA